MTRVAYGEWTPARLALFRDMYPNHGASDRTMNAINGLPGRPFERKVSLVYKASTIGLRLTQEAHARRTAEGSRNATRTPAQQDTTPTFSNGFRHAPLAPIAAPDLPPAEQAAIADAAREKKINRALALLAKRNADPAVVAAACGMKLREACMLAGRLRMGLV